jgi:hypothetical protein
MHARAFHYTNAHGNPLRFQTQLLACQPSLELVAYAGHNSVVLVCSRTQQVVRTMCGGPR